MRIDDILRQDCIIEALEAAGTEEALEKMGRLLYEKGFVKESFIQAIQEREKNYPSGLPMEGHKIAIPHTDAEHVERSVILFARLRTPLEFSVMGDPSQKIQVRLISMFALKEKKLIGDLLETLITSYQEDATLDAIIKAPDAAEMYRILREKVGQNMKDRT